MSVVAVRNRDGLGRCGRAGLGRVMGGRLGGPFEPFRRFQSLQLNRPGFDGDIEGPEGCRSWLLPVSTPTSYASARRVWRSRPQHHCRKPANRLSTKPGA